MADQVRKARYCYVVVRDRAGQGAAVLGGLADAGVNLLGYLGFPAGGRRAQLDFVTDRIGAVRRVARGLGLRVSAVKRCFLVQGEDRPGAVRRHVDRLAEAGISVTAAAGVTAGKRRYGMVLWVKPRLYARAARVLRAR
ncbi:MAG: hypothetical protein ACRENB_04495 [Gemmatimonadales bacterium]